MSSGSHAAQAHAATQSAPQSSSPKQWKGLLPRRSASAPISPTRAGGKGGIGGPPASRAWLTFRDTRLEQRFGRWQAASLARVDCWAVLVALLHLAFLGARPGGLEGLSIDMLLSHILFSEPWRRSL